MQQLMVLLAMGQLSCGGTTSIWGEPTGAVCPSDNTLTYATFGAAFMATYCTRCHATALTGDARQGAPSFHDFDTYFGIKAVAEHIELTTAAGPNATNTGMPPTGASPSATERQQLGQWLACGLPE